MRTDNWVMAAIIQDQGKVKKSKYARFLWPLLRGIVVVVAAWGFIVFLSVAIPHKPPAVPAEEMVLPSLS
jgi:hypothetical protein